MPGMGKGVAELCGACVVSAAAGLGLLHNDETCQHVYVALHDGGVVGGLVDATGLLAPLHDVDQQLVYSPPTPPPTGRGGLLVLVSWSPGLLLHLVSSSPESYYSIEGCSQLGKLWNKC